VEVAAAAGRGRGARPETPIVRASVIATWQVAVVVPAHAPVQGPTPLPGAGVAVNVTVVPSTYASVQSPGHEIPAGVLVTVPGPPACR
jgi:hypothetical protein